MSGTVGVRELKRNIRKFTGTQPDCREANIPSLSPVHAELNHAITGVRIVEVGPLRD